MRIISLNAYRGQERERVGRYIARLGEEADVLCLQEVPKFLYKDLTHCLPDFNGRRIETPERNGEAYENAIFQRDGLSVVRDYGVFTTSGGSMAIEVREGNKNILICNLHGPPQPGHKNLTPERSKFLQESIDFFLSYGSQGGIFGDLNMNPDCLEIFKVAGFRNLIGERKIPRTRTLSAARLAEAKHRHDEKYFGPQPFADYALIFGGLIVEEFHVPNKSEAVEMLYGTDHVPLITTLSV